MKTKNSSFGKAFLSKKRFALVQIAIVLCSVFLVALPTIAAEQNQEMQKVSASEVTTASEDDYVLGVYGNANEDGTIDMRDLTYVKLIFFGKKPEMELADAKYDGKINPLDFIQIKLIIVGKEKELTVVDSSDRIVTVKKPVKRIIPLTSSIFVEALRTLDATDKIVALERRKGYMTYLGELCELPNVGSGGFGPPNYELLLSLKSDLILESRMSYYDGVVDKIESLAPNIPILRLDCVNTMVESGIDSPIEEITKLGYVLDRKDEAEEFSDWYYKSFGSIKARTEKLSDDEKPRVLYGDFKRGGAPEWYAYNKNTLRHQTIEIAGGKNIAEDLDFGVGFGEGACGYVDLEWIIEQNPEIIVRYYLPYVGGRMGIWETYDMDDPSEIIAQREEVLNLPEFANVAAVKNEKVYMLSCDIIYYGASPIAIAHFAKIFHPELFEDLDPQAIHQEFLTRFQRIDYNLDEHGVFVYPEPS